MDNDTIRFLDDTLTVLRHVPGENAVLLMKYDQPPSHCLPLEFTWNRNDLPIEKSERYRIAQSKNAIQLALDHVQREDAGHYTLFAKAKTGKITRKDIELVVEDRSSGDDPPSFVRRLSDLSVKVGTRTRLLVEIRSSSPVKVTWFRNDRRVCENNHIRCVSEGNFYCVELTPVSLDDVGRWMCMVENSSGRNSCLAVLNVLVSKAYKAPEFVEHLRALLTEQGTVSLECKVIGVPTPFLRWFKDSKEIKAGDVFALTANPDDPTSLGTYTCEAVNCMGRMYSSSKVHVVGKGSREGSLKPADSMNNYGTPPIFTDELQNLKIKLGDAITLGCQVVVPPWPKSVVWYNKEGRVESNENIRIVEDGLGMYMIEVKESNSSDEGEWKCVVTSIEGSVGISTCIIEMDIPKNYRKPRFMENLKAVLTDEGLVSFECKVVGFPTPQLKWFKDGQELKPGDVYQLTGTNSLGTYCCVAKNCMGETNSSAILTVEDIQDKLNDEERLVYSQKMNQPPKFMQGLKSQEARINEDFRFFIEVSAQPEPKLSWYRDELPIEDSDRYVILRETAANCQLHIRKIEFVDQAEWKCVATNDYGTSVTSCFLKLQIPRHYKKPKFLECLRAILTEEGAVNLECKVIGVPQPVLKWYKDGIELKAGDIHRIISGQDGTCCLGTYTCEAKNCMGIVASSASILGFDDAGKTTANCTKTEALQRNNSLSTINEERSSQLYETPAGDITMNEKSDISFSFDGKEVSVSLYETPDLTEEEALQIVEMYADQISEHVTEHNVVELPPLRFVKETSQSGNLLMEAVIIDVASEYFLNEDDMRTEADLDNVSINEVSLHGLTTIGESSALSIKNNHDESMSCDIDDYFSLSRATKISDDEDDNTEELVIAKVSEKQRSMAQDAEEFASLEEEQSSKSGSRKRKVSASQTDDPTKKHIVDHQDVEQNINSVVPLAKLIGILERNIITIKEEVNAQSALMMSPVSVDGSLTIIQNILEPISQMRQKLNEYNGQNSLKELFLEVGNDFEKLHQALTVVEKCVSMDQDGHTMIQRTSVCVIDSVGEEFVQLFDAIEQIAENKNQTTAQMEIKLLMNDLRMGIRITQDTIKAQALIQEANAIEVAQHITDTMERVQTVPESMPFECLSTHKLPSDAHNFKNVCRSIVKMQEIVDSAEMNTPPADILRRLMHPIAALELEIQSIEQILNAEKSGVDEMLEEKINMVLWDTVTPPMYELFKSLEILENQSPTRASEICAAILPPLQEIQNGLARIGQDIENGTLGRHSPPVENTDTKRIIDSVNQSLVYLYSNIGAQPLNEIVRLSFIGLRDKLSGLIEAAVECDENSCLTVLNSIKKPIDDLNYCFRQMEERSYSQSPQDILDPLNGLKDGIRRCGEKIEISKRTIKCQTILSELKQQIESTEQNYMQKCIFDQIGFNTLEKQEITAVQFAELHRCIVTIPMHLPNLATIFESFGTVDDISIFQSIEQPIKLLKEIIDSNPEGFIDADQMNDDNWPILKSAARPLLSLKKQAQSLDESTLHKLHAISFSVENSDSAPLMPVIDLIVCMDSIGLQTIEQFARSVAPEIVPEIIVNVEHLKRCISNTKREETVNALDDISTVTGLAGLTAIAEPLNELHNFIENNQIECESIDEMQCLSQLKKVAKPLHEIKDFVTTTEGQLAIQFGTDISETDDMKTKAQPLLELLSCIDQMKETVFEQLTELSYQESNTELQNTANDKKRTANVVLLPELGRCVHNVQEHGTIDILEDLSTISNLSDLKTMAQPMRELQHALQVHSTQLIDSEESLIEQTPLIANIVNSMTEIREYATSVKGQHELLQLAKDLSETYNDQLKSHAQPLFELLECVEKFGVEAFEHVSSLSKQQNITELEKTDDNRRRCANIKLIPQVVQAISETQQLETLRVISDFNKETFNLQKIAKPLHELQHYIESNQLQSIQETKQLSEAENVSLLKEIAKPLMEIRDFAWSTEGQVVLEMQQDLSISDRTKLLVKPIFDLCMFATNLEFNVIEPDTAQTQEDISEIENVTEIDDVVTETDVFQHELASSLQYLGQSINVIEAKTIELPDIKHFAVLSKPLSDVKFAIESQADKQVDYEIILQLLSHLRENLAGINLDDSLECTPELIEIHSELITLENRLNDALLSIEDVNRPPIEAVIAHIQSPIRTMCQCQKLIEAISVTSSAAIVEEIKKPLNDLEISLQHLARFIAENPLQHISRNTNEIQTFIAELQQIESQLFFAHENLSTSTYSLSAGKLSEAINVLKGQLSIVQNAIQYAESLHPLLITKSIDTLTPTVNLNASLSNILSVNDACKENKVDSIPKETGNQIASILNAINIGELKDINTNALKLLNEIHNSVTELKDRKFTNDIIQFDEHIQQLKNGLSTLIQNEPPLTVSNQWSELKTNIMLLDNYRTIRSQHIPEVCRLFAQMQQDIVQIGKAMQAMAIEGSTDRKPDATDLKAEMTSLLQKSEEKRLTPDEEDRLNSLLTRINLLDSKIHDTVFDAKIINESTANIIEQLKEDLETRDELKKNVDSENASGEAFTESKPHTIQTATDNIECIKYEHEQPRTESENKLYDDTIDSQLGIQDTQETKYTQDIHKHEAQQLNLAHQLNFIDETNIFEAELNADLCALYLSINSIAIERSHLTDDDFQLISQPISYIQQALESLQETHSIDLQTLSYLLSDLRQSMESVTAYSVATVSENNLHLLKKYINNAIVSTQDLNRPPIEAVMGHLEQPNENLERCLHTVMHSTGVISQLQKPLNDLKDSIAHITNFIVQDPLQNISRNTPNIQQFIAELQTIESQLFFLQQRCYESTSVPLHLEIGDAVMYVKNQLEHVQNTIQYSEDIHPLLLTKAVDLLSHPLDSLNEICDKVNTLESKCEYLVNKTVDSQSSHQLKQIMDISQQAEVNVSVLEEDGTTAPEHHIKIKTDSEILIDEFNSSIFELRNCITMLLNGQLLTLKPYKVLSRPLTHLAKAMETSQNTTDDIQSISNLLWDLKEKLELIKCMEIEKNPKFN